MHIEENLKVLNIYKDLNLTPLEVINQFKSSFPSYKNKKMAYAGRLDPLATGVLLILVDEECKNRDAYQDLEKEYKFDLLLGIKTDTNDTMGIILNSVVDSETLKVSNEELETYISSIKSQSYPHYSSFHVDGKPLFQWAKEGRINEIKIPSKDISIENIEILGNFIIDKNELLKLSFDRLDKVKGDFRQEQIKNDWIAKLGQDNLKFLVTTIKISVSSGTYIRSICDEIGDRLGTGGIALNITRTRVGEFNIEDSIRLND